MSLATCTIDFTFDVLKSPTGDQDPATPGVQTAQATEHTQFAGPFGPGALSNFARATSNGTTVQRPRPRSSTNASPDMALGAGQLADTATVNGRVNPTPGATIDFRLYGPNDANCTGAPIFQALGVPYPGRRRAGDVAAVHADAGGHVPLDRRLQRRREQPALDRRVQRRQRDDRRRAGAADDRDERLGGHRARCRAR